MGMTTPPQPITDVSEVHLSTVDMTTEILLFETEKRMKEAQLRDDLVTIIDVCDAMATWAKARPRTEHLALRAIHEAHDMMHVLTGRDRVMSWDGLKAVITLPDAVSDVFGPAWPDVRRRMADVIERAEGMAK